ncbi:MAG: glycosyltransferase family 39 protein [Thermoanaerobaculales bacterium]
MGEWFSRVITEAAASKRVQALLLAGLIFAVLAPALGSDFIWDDINQIVDSPTIGDPRRIPSYFTHNVVESMGSEGRGAEGVDTYRPLFMVALAAVYAVAGPDPFGFHLAVLAAHLMVSLLLWTLADRWLDSRLATVLAVLFFACHPVTAEAYLWCSAISEPMSSAGLLGAVLLLDRYCRNDRRDSAGWRAALAAGVVFLAGLLSKEAVLMALPAVSLYLLWARRVRLRWLTPLWAAAAIFLAMRVFALGGLQAGGADGEQRLHALRVYPVLVLDGLRAMLGLWPVGIRHLSWEYERIGWGMSAIAALGCIVLVTVAIVLRRRTPLVLLAVTITGLMLAPIAMVATVPGWGGFGRYLYLPLAFTSLALAEIGPYAHSWLSTNRPRLRWAIPLLVAVVLIVEQIGLRNALWVYANQENLARAAIEIFPDGPDGYEWLGNAFLARGDLPAALICYRQATERGPELYRPRHNLAAALLYTGRPEEALEQLAIAEALHGATSDGSTVVITALLRLRRWNEATDRLLDALERAPADPALRRLGARLLAEHPRPEALRARLAAELTSERRRHAAEVLTRMIHQGSQ